MCASDALAAVRQEPSPKDATQARQARPESPDVGAQRLDGHAEFRPPLLPEQDKSVADQSEALRRDELGQSEERVLQAEFQPLPHWHLRSSVQLLPLLRELQAQSLGQPLQPPVQALPRPESPEP